MTPIDCICKGTPPNPLKFRYFDENGDEHIVKVDRSVSRSSVRDSQFVVECGSIMNGIMKKYKLIFDKYKYIWYLDI